MHKWEWKGDSFEFDIAGVTASFIGAWICSLCGMRLPCYDEQIKELLGSIAMDPKYELPDECDLIACEKILSY